MTKVYYNYRPQNIEKFKTKALIYANKHSHVFYSSANDIPFPYDPFKNLLAFGCAKSLSFSESNNFEELKEHVNNGGNWLFGHLSYDLKNQIENLHSNHKDHIETPQIAFFEPKNLLQFNTDTVDFIISDDNQELIDEIDKVILPESFHFSFDNITCDTSRQEYIETVNQLKQHIIEGDIYEINYCIEFLVHNLTINPVAFFSKLSIKSPSPFSSFYKHHEHYLLGASPERYLRKTGDELISQPIKGTAKRGQDTAEDENIKKALKTSEKELAENMMIVDLVRNDLARSCLAGSVTVPEMFGIYTFKHLHQMISTVKGKLRPDTHFVDAIKNSFPMGSMTGAPKIKVMQLIEQYEKSKRGLYSGALGYFTPERDFDFNVVIRSLLYNQKKKIASLQVGSAITYDAIPELEYDECLLKASAIRSLLNEN